MTKFAAGSSYSTRSICDHECIFRFTVVSRTEKTIVLSSHGRVVRRRVREWNGVECVDPHGRYSMSPVLSASDLDAA